MDSMSAACTPLKHKYDACFTNWFVEYLGLPQDASDGPKVASSDSFGSAGFWSRGKSAGGEGSDRRTALREKLEGECGAVWSAYRDCVKRAVVEKQLEGPIAEARAHNPFPFPGHDSGAPHTPPFPFASQAGAKDP
ncbi:hypothetical protein IE81DRAFT_291605 [Ceraceosorus guamensis]|uniref:Uncharacterized protein n=1 Tax=Ceraceosorus guamensis TaxID=1522189 RepID=A0A316VXI8_9BASI|nr:hypothetical protein IE81DRAFT_291605 [Ceraceosorus guamensis]PWN41608.1 hypothetical protein IE81DRAFT_291605 [Ceraceosorus guamensis]